MQRRPSRRSLVTRIELAITVVAFGLIGLLIVAAPNTTGGGMSRGAPAVLSWLVYGAGVAGILVGAIWIVRVARSLREDDASTWRSRRH
jgi:hypothetical protein